MSFLTRYNRLDPSTHSAAGAHGSAPPCSPGLHLGHMGAGADHEHQEILLGPGRVREVHHQTSGEADLWGAAKRVEGWVMRTRSGAVHRPTFPTFIAAETIISACKAFSG